MTYLTEGLKHTYENKRNGNHRATDYIGERKPLLKEYCRGNNAEDENSRIIEGPEKVYVHKRCYKNQHIDRKSRAQHRANEEDKGHAGNAKEPRSLFSVFCKKENKIDNRGNAEGVYKHLSNKSGTIRRKLIASITTVKNKRMKKQD